MGLVIDTSALIEAERSDVAWDRVAPGDENVVLPVIVWAELLIGVRLARTPQQAAQRRARLERLRLAVPIIDFTPAMAEHYADLYAALSESGKMIPQNDLAVAATALSSGYGVLVGSHDERHFRRIPGLRVASVHRANSR